MLRCFQRYIADFISSIQIFAAQKNNDLVYMTGLNLARIRYMELQGIAKCVFYSSRRRCLGEPRMFFASFVVVVVGGGVGGVEVVVVSTKKSKISFLSIRCK